MTVFAPFAADSDYFPDDQPFMLKIAVERRPEWEAESRRFVRVHDPEGLPIELWELPNQAGSH